MAQVVFLLRYDLLESQLKTTYSALSFYSVRMKSPCIPVFSGPWGICLVLSFTITIPHAISSCICTAYGLSKALTRCFAVQEFSFQYPTLQFLAEISASSAQQDISALIRFHFLLLLSGKFPKVENWNKCRDYFMYFFSIKNHILPVL